eukprot:6136542-Pleurochrysis_carterae.AAC.3
MLARKQLALESEFLVLSLAQNDDLADVVQRNLMVIPSTEHALRSVQGTTRKRNIHRQRWSGEHTWECICATTNLSRQHHEDKSANAPTRTHEMRTRTHAIRTRAHAGAGGDAHAHAHA